MKRKTLFNLFTLSNRVAALCVAVTLTLTLFCNLLSAADLPANWNEMPYQEKAIWLFQNAPSLTPDTLREILKNSAILQEGTSIEDFQKMSPAELLQYLSNPSGILILPEPTSPGTTTESAPEASVASQREIKFTQLPALTPDQVKELIRIDEGWRRIVGTSLNHRFGRVSEDDYNRVLDLLERMEGFKNELLKLELGETPYKRGLYRRITDIAQQATGTPEKLEELSDFFLNLSRRTGDRRRLGALFESITRHTGMFHIEFANFRSVERFIVFELKRELKKLEDKERNSPYANPLIENEKRTKEHLKTALDDKLVSKATALPSLVENSVNKLRPEPIESANEGLKNNILKRIDLWIQEKYQKHLVSPKRTILKSVQAGHEAFKEILTRLSASSGEKAEGRATNRGRLQELRNLGKNLRTFFDDNKELTIELLETTSEIKDSDIPATLRRELAESGNLRSIVKKGGESFGLRSTDERSLVNPTSLGIKNSLIYQRGRFVGFVGTTLNFYTTILISDFLLNNTYFTGEDANSWHHPQFFTIAKDLLFNVGSHVHFATFSVAVAANKSVYEGAIRSLVPKFPLLKILTRNNPAALFFSEFLGFMPGMFANSAGWGSLLHSATPAIYDLLTKGYFTEAGRLVASVWCERVAQASLFANTTSVVTLFCVMKYAQQIVTKLVLNSAKVATATFTPVGVAFGVLTFYLAGILEDYLSGWVNTLEINSYVDSSTEKLVAAENELVSRNNLFSLFEEIPGLYEGIEERYDVSLYRYKNKESYYDGNEEFTQFITDCWFSILDGSGAFSILITPLVKYEDAKEIVNRIRYLEQLVTLRERLILGRMSDKDSSKNLNNAIWQIEDLSVSFGKRFNHRELKIVPLLFANAADIRIHAEALANGHYATAREDIAGKGGKIAAYQVYELKWLLESKFKDIREEYFNHFTGIVNQSFNIPNLKVGLDLEISNGEKKLAECKQRFDEACLLIDEGLKEHPELEVDLAKRRVEASEGYKKEVNEIQGNLNDAKDDFDSKDKEYRVAFEKAAEELATAAFRIEMHKLMKKDFWRQCKKDGFLALDWDEQENHHSYRKQIIIENEWKELWRSPQTRLLLANRDKYEVSKLYTWATSLSTYMLMYPDFLLNDAVPPDFIIPSKIDIRYEPDWSWIFNNNEYSVDGGISFYLQKEPSTPWTSLAPSKRELEIGTQLAKDILLSLNLYPEPTDYDPDLLHLENESGFLLLFNLQNIVKENNLDRNIDLNSDLQSSWVKDLVTDPMSGRCNKSDFNEAAAQVKGISNRDWSVLNSYNIGILDKNTFAAKTSEELAFWLNGYVGASSPSIGKGARESQQRWWLKKVVEAAFRLFKERESIRLIQQGVIPVIAPDISDKTKPYKHLFEKENDIRVSIPRVKASDFREEVFYKRVGHFFENADPQGILQEEYQLLDKNITRYMTNPYAEEGGSIDKDKTDLTESLIENNRPNQLPAPPNEEPNEQIKTGINTEFTQEEAWLLASYNEFQDLNKTKDIYILERLVESIQMDRRSKLSILNIIKIKYRDFNTAKKNFLATDRTNSEITQYDDHEIQRLVTAIKASAYDTVDQQDLETVRRIELQQFNTLISGDYDSEQFKDICDLIRSNVEDNNFTVTTYSDLALRDFSFNAFEFVNLVTNFKGSTTPLQTPPNFSFWLNKLFKSLNNQLVEQEAIKTAQDGKLPIFGDFKLDVVSNNDVVAVESSNVLFQADDNFNFSDNAKRNIESLIKQVESLEGGDDFLTYLRAIQSKF